MSALKVGQVCPGYVGCDIGIHHTLVFFDALVPYILGHLLMPMVINSKVLYINTLAEPTDENDSDIGISRT